MIESAELELIQFADNPEPRCPCVLLLDTSGSMQGEKIDALNDGLRTLKACLMDDPLAMKRVEIAVVTFNNKVNIEHDFVTADKFEPPTLTASGLTCLGSGVLQALDMLQERKAVYKSNGVAYYRPWILLITDGEPQGEYEETIQQAIQRIAKDEKEHRVAFFAVGVAGANMKKLAEIAVRTPLALIGLNFRELFAWLSASMAAVVEHRIDEQVALPPPGWGLL